MTHRKSWWALAPAITLLALVAVLLVPLGGCMSIDPAGQVKTMLADPAVQATLERWAVKGSAHNPGARFECGTYGEVSFPGIDAEGEISGDVRSGGIDAERLDRLTAILERVAEKVGAPVPPAPAPEKPAVPAPEKPTAASPPSAASEAQASWETQIVDPATTKPSSGVPGLGPPLVYATSTPRTRTTGLARPTSAASPSRPAPSGPPADLTPDRLIRCPG